MYKYVLKHEQWLQEQIKSSKGAASDLLAYHNRQIAWLQHERLAHLLVTLFTAFLFVASVALFFFRPRILEGVLAVLLAVLTFFYIIHYYRLENAVQRWYIISNSLQEQIIDM